MLLLAVMNCAAPTGTPWTADPVASDPAPVATGVDGTWCRDDVVPTDATFVPVESLSLSKAIWGVEAPNLVKAVTVAWDPVGGRLYGAAMATDRLVAVDPAVGRPVGVVDLDVRGNTVPLLRIDPARHRLFRIDKSSGGLRVVDLVSGHLVARRDPERSGERKFRFRDAAVDPATGWLWVAELGEGGLVGYSPDLKQSSVAAGIQWPAALDALPDRLVIIEAASRADQQLTEFRPSTGAVVSRTPLASAGRTGVTLAPDGTRLLHDDALTALTADGQPRWTQPLSHPAEDVAVSGGIVGVLLGGGARPPRARGSRTEAPLPSVVPPAEGHVLFFDLATGEARGDIAVGFEPTSLTAGVGEFFVGNGGEASATRITSVGVTTTLDLGFAAERVAVDPKTGARYVLDRLGGSGVHRWAADGGVTTRAAARWPSDLVIDAVRRKGYTLGHYDALLDVWDLDTGETTTIPLELSPSRTDTLSDMDLDRRSGLLAAVYPETGGLVVVDTVMRTVVWGRTEARLRAGPKAGPGKAFVLADGDANRLYVVAGTVVYAYALRTGAELGSVSLTAAPSWHVDGAWLDRENQRLYAGSTVVKVPDLTLDGVLPLSMVFWADDERILGLEEAEPGADRSGGAARRRPERLIELDPRTRQVRFSRPLVATGMMHLSPTYDPENKRVYVADLAEGRVIAWAWPER